MTLLKCKMCGGDIELSSDKTYGTCDSCGSTVTLPKASDEQKAGLFNRGNALRMRMEFDKAATVFEKIVEQDETDAEAHWCLVLCRYGIEYVEDPKSGERIPTCHRASYDSLLNDVDYQAAITHSDSQTASIYTTEAKKIADLQKAIIAVSRQEEPYDVFICYKETTSGGARTKDSVVAQDIYYELTNAGYKVFFSRITLEGKLGTEYEPYIFAALQSAKVMLVIGTSAEHFNAVWVKNEWSRFQSIMKNDRSRLLIPCYRDMDPYDIPDELASLQSQDMGKIGFIQDITRGIKKVLGGGEDDAKAKASAAAAAMAMAAAGVGGTSVDRLIENGNTHITKLNDYTSAHKCFIRATEEYPGDHRGWWGLILCETANLTENTEDWESLNRWFANVKRLTDTNTFAPLEKEYVEYTKKMSTLQAKEECATVNDIINQASTDIATLTGQQQQVVQAISEYQNEFKKKRWVSPKLDDAIAKRDKLERERKLITYFLIGGIVGIFISLLLIVLGEEANVESIVVMAGIIGVASFFDLVILWHGCFNPKNPNLINRKRAISDLEEFIINEKAKYSKQKKDDTKQYTEYMANAKEQIATIDHDIATAKKRISACNGYLTLGENKIAEALFAAMCADFGVKQPTDTTVTRFREAALNGVALPITCPECNTEVPNDATECTNCGYPLKETLTADTVDTFEVA